MVKYIFLNGFRHKEYPDGNILWAKEKNFGMGQDHPVERSNDAGAGHVFYTSLGHSAGTQSEFIRLVENAVNAW